MIESVLTEAANQGGDRFPLAWIRSRSKLFLATPGPKLTFCDSPSTGEKSEEATRPSLEQSNFECFDGWGVLRRFPLSRLILMRPQEQLGYFILDKGPRARDITVYMTEGGRHEYILTNYVRNSVLIGKLDLQIYPQGYGNHGRNEDHDF